MISPLQYQEMQARLSRNPLRDQKPDDAVKVESELHQQILKECALRGFLVIHSRMDQASTCEKGVPDFAILIDQNRVLLVEAKSSAGKLSSEQAIWIMRAKDLGHTVHIVRSYAEFLDVVHLRK